MPNFYSTKSNNLKLFILLMILSILISCSHKQKNDLKILADFSERVEALITTTIRSNIRDYPLKQKLLVEKLSFLENQTTFIGLIDELKKVDQLKDLAYIIEADIFFELQRQENWHRRENFNSPEVQKELLNATLTGIKQTLSQLRGEKNGK